MKSKEKIPEFDFYKMLRDAEDKKLATMTEAEREAYFEKKEKDSIEMAKRLKLNVIELKKMIKREDSNEWVLSNPSGLFWY